MPSYGEFILPPPLDDRPVADPPPAKPQLPDPGSVPLMSTNANADTEHGTQSAINKHKRGGSPLCPECSVFHSDYQRGRRIAYAGPKRQITISAGSLARLLRGEPVAQVLAGEYGPCTMAALHEISMRHKGVGDA